MESNLFVRGFLWTAVLAALSPLAAAQGPVSLSGFDVLNTSGVAHSFEAEYSNLPVSAYLGFDTSSYSSVTASATPTGSKVRWTGGTTNVGEWSHFGLYLDEEPPLDPRVVSYTYGSGSSLRAETGTKSYQIWETDSYNNRTDKWVTSAAAAVQRRVTTFGGELDFADLVRGGALWAQATVIDDQFVDIPAEGLVYQYETMPDNVWSIMIADVLDRNTGIVDMTFVNAYRVTPEPMSAISLTLGALCLVGRGRRERQ